MVALCRWLHLSGRECGALGGHVINLLPIVFTKKFHTHSLISIADVCCFLLFRCAIYGRKYKFLQVSYLQWGSGLLVLLSLPLEGIHQSFTIGQNLDPLNHSRSRGQILKWLMGIHTCASGRISTIWEQVLRWHRSCPCHCLHRINNNLPSITWGVYSSIIHQEHVVDFQYDTNSYKFLIIWEVITLGGYASTSLV